MTILNHRGQVAVVGSGLAGLAVACLLGASGYDVTVYEKNEKLGGVCNTFTDKGFTFDMGPSWYLMPDVFERFFSLLGERVESFLDLVRLSPSYRVVFKNENEDVELYSDLDRDSAVFDRLEPGSSLRLREYLAQSEQQYNTAINAVLYKNCDTIFDFICPELTDTGKKMPVFTKMHDYVSRYFSNKLVQKLVEYQLVFLGSSPYDTPALYNIMSHIDFNMGVFYPMGGIYKIAEALVAIGRKHGVRYLTNSPVSEILVHGGRVKGIKLWDDEAIQYDIVVSDAGIHHTETQLLPRKARSYSDRYWASRTLAPSAFILYLGIEGRVPGLRHHNLIFSKDWRENFDQLFANPMWPTDPSIYICAPSVTDAGVAPDGHENLFVLVPIAPGLPESEELLEEYTRKILKTVSEQLCIADIDRRIVSMRRFTGSDFYQQYNHFKGSALGLAHTLSQTAFLRPNNRSRKVRGLYYVGADTNPGIGMPICLISAELAYKRIVGNNSRPHLEALL
jgi:phytoene desaturase